MAGRWRAELRSPEGGDKQHACTHTQCTHGVHTQVRADKLREVQAGHDGTWVAHPDLVKVGRRGGPWSIPEADGGSGASPEDESVRQPPFAHTR